MRVMSPSLTASRRHGTRSPSEETRGTIISVARQGGACTPASKPTGIATPLSFDWSCHYSWLSAFADRWVMGLKGSKGSASHWDLPDRQCPHCDGIHPLDLPLCVAFCANICPFLHQMADAWGFALAPVVHSWLQDQVRTKGERPLVLLTIYRQLIPHPSQKSVLRGGLPSRRSHLTSIVEAVCTTRRDHPLPEPLPPPLGANPFFVSHVPYSTSDGPPSTPQHLYHPPPPPQCQRQSPSKPPRAGAQSKLPPHVQDTVCLHKKAKRTPAASPRLHLSFVLATSDTLSASHRTLLTWQAYIRPWARPHSRMVHRRTIHGHQLRGVAIQPLYLTSTVCLAPLLPESGVSYNHPSLSLVQPCSCSPPALPPRSPE